MRTRPDGLKKRQGGVSLQVVHFFKVPQWRTLRHFLYAVLGGFAPKRRGAGRLNRWFGALAGKGWYHSGREEGKVEFMELVNTGSGQQYLPWMLQLSDALSTYDPG